MVSARNAKMNIIQSWPLGAYRYRKPLSFLYLRKRGGKTRNLQGSSARVVYPRTVLEAQSSPIVLISWGLKHSPEHRTCSAEIREDTDSPSATEGSIHHRDNNFMQRCPSQGHQAARCQDGRADPGKDKVTWGWVLGIQEPVLWTQTLRGCFPDNRPMLSGLENYS